MQINLSPETLKKIERFIASGKFRSPDDVVEAAVEEFCEPDDAIANIRQGLDDEAAGRLHSLADADAYLRRKNSIPKT